MLDLADGLRGRPLQSNTQSEVPEERNSHLAGILIIGIGNRLRGDDAVGVLAAQELETYFRDDEEVKVIAEQQLLPEMAELVAHSSFVLFLDACDGREPGMIECLQLMPDAGEPGWTHHLTPGSLLDAAQQIYGQAPCAVSLTLAGWSFALSSDISSGVRARLPEFIRLAKETVATRR